MAYKIVPGRWRKLQKLVHMLLHMAALLVGGLGLYAVFKSQREEQGMPDMYSLHSWIGLGSICLYALQVRNDPRATAKFDHAGAHVLSSTGILRMPSACMHVIYCYLHGAVAAGLLLVLVPARGEADEGEHPAVARLRRRGHLPHGGLRRRDGVAAEVVCPGADSWQGGPPRELYGAGDPVLRSRCRAHCYPAAGVVLSLRDRNMFDLSALYLVTNVAVSLRP